jgi:Zinc-finger of C2H2 type
VTNSSPPLHSQQIQNDRPNPVVPAPLSSQQISGDRIPRLATPTQPNGSAPNCWTSARAQPTTSAPRSKAVLRERETRTGYRLARVSVASTIRNQRRLWKCNLCDLTLTSAKAKHDHINGRRHKARVEERHGYCCGPCDLQLSSARDLETQTKGRRDLRAIVSRNSHNFEYAPCFFLIGVNRLLQTCLQLIVIPVHYSYGKHRRIIIPSNNAISH